MVELIIDNKQRIILTSSIISYNNYSYVILENQNGFGGMGKKPDSIPLRGFKFLHTQ